MDIYNQHKEEFDAVSAVLAAARKRIYNILQKLIRSFVDDGQDNAGKN